MAVETSGERSNHVWIKYNLISSDPKLFYQATIATGHQLLAYKDKYCKIDFPVTVSSGKINLSII